MTSTANEILSRFSGLQVVRSRKLQRLKEVRDDLQKRTTDLQKRTTALQKRTTDLQQRTTDLENNIAEMKRAVEGEAFAHVSDDSLMLSLKKMIEEGKLQIILPTINSEAYIDIVLGYYVKLGIPVKVIVDSKTRDATASIAKKYCEVEMMINNTTRVHGIIEKFSLSSRSEWILRMDDDELPSLSMLQFIASVIQDDANDVCGFPRLQCVTSLNGSLLASVHHSPEDHRQWRLYRRLKVKYIEAGHTPGFEVPECGRLRAPGPASMIHLDWCLHSYARRLSKIKRYDAHTQNHGSHFRSFYLYEEDQAQSAEHLKLIRRSEFYEIAKRISERFPGNCIVDKNNQFKGGDSSVRRADIAAAILDCA